MPVDFATSDQKGPYIKQENLLPAMSSPKRIKLEASTQLLPILPDDLVEETPLTEVYVDKITNPKSTSEVILSLNLCLPIPELSHLKRVRSNEVILCPAADLLPTEVHGILENKGFNSDLLSKEVRIVLVAKIPPKTTKQYLKVHKLWPCNFHSDKYTEKLSSNTLFNISEINEHKKYMDMAISVAKRVKQLKLSSKCQGVVVLDPKINSVVAIGYSDTHNNPIRHAVMIAIDNVAKTQNGGAWKLYESITANTTSRDLSGIHSQLWPMLKEEYPEVCFGATLFKGKNEFSEPSEGPYLCTNYYIYTTHEPCVMCAMALVHSRVKRVFYGVGTKSGGLGTTCKIHTVKDLNHHYEVFAKLCEDNCKSLTSLD